MQQQGSTASRFGLKIHGIANARTVWWNLSTPALYEQALARNEGILAHLGPLVVRTGQYTGRSPKDRFIVREPTTENKIAWGDVNRPFDPERYEALRKRLLAYLEGKDLFVQDCYAGADLAYRLPLRVVTQKAWHALFARNMFIQEPDPEKLARHRPQFTVINACGYNADPEEHDTHSEAFILVNLARKEVLIGGTQYGGEMKKSVFTVMSFLLPEHNVLPMHCSANYGRDPSDVALFFGLSGTGKTTLSADSQRTLIGDDEHGWSDKGIFNFEGGCYAKVIRLSEQGEPEIYETTRRFGTILENVAIDADNRRLDLDSDVFTENTRAAYPIAHIPNATRDGLGGHPRQVIFLTADAFGVLPPFSRLSPEQAMYHFLSGYTAKVAGTERGITEPQPNFSACFGEPFMALDPVVYARLLGDKIARHRSQVWLVNTGWTGGPYGEGRRMDLEHTRAMVRAALAGTMDHVAMTPDPVFGVMVPQAVPDVPPEVLNPRGTWKESTAYDAQAARLAAMFRKNFESFRDRVPPEVRDAGPRE